MIAILALTLISCKGNSGSGQTESPITPIADDSTKYSCKGGDIVNGYMLPPCPDEKLNDSTLLGIDSNNNGVRDDVERWLIVKYKDKHRIVTEIGFQTARAAQIIIQDPSKARETTKIMEAAQACNVYFTVDADEFGDPILIDHTIIVSKDFKSIQFNTAERIKAYLDHNRALSGGVYTLPKGSYKRFCDFDVDGMLGKQQ
jgi:hypothetical protein